MADVSQIKKPENEQVETPVSPDLGLPKPVDASMHEALKTTVETLRHDQQLEKPITPEKAAKPAIEQAAEKVAVPEAAPELVTEQKKPEPTELVKKIETTVPVTVPMAPAAPAVVKVKDELIDEIDGVLGEGLEGDYQRMTPDLQVKFKLKGEETAKEIGGILRSSKIQIKKIINLILNWLRIIPGVNHYFLTQEAKIKSDKIVLLREEIIKDKGKII